MQEENVSGDVQPVTAPAAAIEKQTPANTDSAAYVEANSDGSDASQHDESQTPEDLEASEAGRKLAQHKKSATARIAEITYKFRDAERRAAAAEQRDKELEAEGRPSPDGFQNMDDFEAARISWAVKNARAEELKGDAHAMRQEAQSAQIEAWQERTIDYQSENPDFDGGVTLAGAVRDFGGAQTLATAIMESDSGPAIAHHLTKHIDLAKRIAAMRGPAQLLELGRIAERISQKATPRVTKAPPPIPTVTGSASPAPKDPSKMTELEYIEWYKSRRK